jgi:glutathione S-transferase
MPSMLRLFDLAPSPNNMKVRLGARYKGVAYERVTVGPTERDAVLKATGQPLTPAIVHGDVKLFDSSAILRYIDANFPGPRLFPDTREGLRDVERWELHARTQLGASIRIAFGLMLERREAPDEAREASRLMHAATAVIEERLADHDWLVGDSLSAAECACAPCVWYAMVPEEAAVPHTVAGFMRQHLELGEDRERTRAWVLRAMAYCEA